MADTLCGVCASEPKKYKCPTCALPYCSLACFKTHKPTHSEPSTSSLPTPSHNEPALSQPSQPPAPTPRYLKHRVDFSLLASNPKFQTLLKTHPALLPSLQRVYAKTIQPNPEDERRRRMLERSAFRGRGTRGRRRGRGGGRGGRGGWNGHEEREERWTQKKGDKDAMGVLKEIRSAQTREGDKDAMAQFVGLVDELFGQREKGEREGV
ncbi:HIT finger domain [Pyrenophora seminiperda CCB06]|uniref:HIT finger domain n=1 Tax=Pyrenophora seminiperda CCB06 TaxID=1302712 RepID=A0A3M7MIW9_9PLEO|nr:HIT finger domain [Pyrenophora seminiperda CCB06]